MRKSLHATCFCATDQSQLLGALSRSASECVEVKMCACATVDVSMAHRYKPAHRSLPAYMGSHKFALPKPPAAGPPPSRGSDTRPAGRCTAGTPYTHAGSCGCKSWVLGCRSSALLQRCWHELCQTGSSPAGSPDRPGPSASCLCTAVCMPEAQGLHEHPSCCI